MQGGFCAYCECRLNRKHVEHFRPRKDFPALTFEWTNLFGSCGDTHKAGAGNGAAYIKMTALSSTMPTSLLSLMMISRMTICYS
nr:retron system putative HNH endonuclease [Enterobacter hormaechei]